MGWIMHERDIVCVREREIGRTQCKPFHSQMRKVKKGMTGGFDCFGRVICQGKLTAPIGSIDDR